MIGIWCDYFSNEVTPTDQTTPPSNVYSVITYSGTKPEIKIGGSYKKFTVTFYNDTEPIDYMAGNWSFTIDGNDASDLLSFLSHEESSDVEQNQIKVKFTGDDSYIGKVIVVSHTSIEGITSNVEINLVGI